MKPITLAIHEDEPAWSLREINLVRPPHFQWRRYQIITVVRDDVLTEWWDDLGAVEDYPHAQQLEMPSLGILSVAKIRAEAERHRHDDYWHKFSLEQIAESTLIQDYVNYVEENFQIINNRSVYGPGFHHQRDGFPKEEVLRGHRTG